MWVEPTEYGISGTCPNCKARLAVKASEVAGFCPCCGGKVIHSFRVDRRIEFGHDVSSHLQALVDSTERAAKAVDR